jgi:hypothetical protein
MISRFVLWSAAGMSTAMPAGAGIAFAETGSEPGGGDTTSFHSTKPDAAKVDSGQKSDGDDAKTPTDSKQTESKPAPSGCRPSVPDGRAAHQPGPAPQLRPVELVINALWSSPSASSRCSRGTARSIPARHSPQKRPF